MKSVKIVIQIAKIKSDAGSRSACSMVRAFVHTLKGHGSDSQSRAIGGLQAPLLA